MRVFCFSRSQTSPNISELAACACPLAFARFDRCEIGRLRARQAFGRARSRSVCLRIVKLAVCARPLAFGFVASCKIGRSRAPAHIWLLCSMLNWPIARARSHSVALPILNLQLARTQNRLWPSNLLFLVKVNQTVD